MEDDLATVEGKKKMDKLPALYTLLVEKYKLWYEIFSDGRIPSKSTEPSANDRSKRGNGNNLSKGDGGSKNTKDKLREKATTIPTRTPICYICDGDDHWNPKCPIRNETVFGVAIDATVTSI